MIIDETFMWLYATFKIGRAFIIPMVLSVIALLVMIPIFFEFGERGRDLAIKVWKICPFVFVISTFMVTLTPDSNEVYQYLKYTIGEKVANSDEAKRLIEATINKLEN